MALKLAPFLLLDTTQLALPALALLPISPTTILLMAISQLPSVLANATGADVSLAAAGNLSTLVATAWAKYLARSQTTEIDIGPDTVLLYKETPHHRLINSVFKP